MSVCVCVRVCVCAYRQLVYRYNSSSEQQSAHVLCGRQKQVPSPPPHSTTFPSSSSPSSDDIHPLRAALHAGRRLSAHVLCGGQRQGPPPPAAQGVGSGCTVTNSMHQDIPSVPVECAVCFAHPVTHMCASLASIWLARPPQQVWLARPPQPQVWLARPPQHTSLAC